MGGKEDGEQEHRNLTCPSVCRGTGRPPVGESAAHPAPLSFPGHRFQVGAPTAFRAGPLPLVPGGSVCVANKDRDGRPELGMRPGPSSGARLEQGTPRRAVAGRQPRQRAGASESIPDQGFGRSTCSDQSPQSSLAPTRPPSPTLPTPTPPRPSLNAVSPSDLVSDYLCVAPANKFI